MAGKAVITSVVAGGITLSPFVFVSFTAFGIIVKIVESAKKYAKKIERANFGRTEYKKFWMRFLFTSEVNLSTKKSFLVG